MKLFNKYSYLIRVNRPYIFGEMIGFVLLIVGTLASLANPYIMKVFVDSVLINSETERMFTVMLLVIGVLLFQRYLTLYELLF